MLVSKGRKPPTGGMGGSIHDWERGLDSWHVNAFKDTGVLETSLDKAVCIGVEGIGRGVRREGWLAVDGSGNVIGFVADGTELDHD